MFRSGDTNKKVKNSFESAIFGLSGYSPNNLNYQRNSQVTCFFSNIFQSHLSSCDQKTGSRLLSAVGSFDNSGALFTYNNTDGTNPFEFKYLVKPNNSDVTSSDYLGKLL